jgi:hypothetical protein
MAEAFDQHPAVALALFNPLVRFFESSVKSLFQRLESLVDDLKSLVDTLFQGLEPLVQGLEPPVKVLNEFLVHASSSAARVCRSTFLVNETRHAGKG